MDGNALGLAAVAALLLANGFFVATEFAIVAVRKSRLEQLAAEGHDAARAAREVVGHLDTYIAACQLGITMASLALGWIGEPAVSNVVEPPLERLVGAWAHDVAEAVSAVASFALITTLHIVIGELAPKGFALQRTEATALFVARPMRLFQTIFRWPIAALNGIGNGLLGLFGLDPAAGHENVHSVEELRLLVRGMQQAGVVDDTEAKIAGRAFMLGEVSVQELMTPRTEVDAVPATATIEAALEVALAGGHSRLLVHNGSLDEVRGIVLLRDLVRAHLSGAHDLRELIRPVLITPASRRVDALLEEMRASRRQLVVVLDEYGGTAGIATLEDLIEALVGRIEQEPERGDAGLLTREAAEADGSLVLDGLTRLDEFEELTGQRVAPGLREGVDTVGGLVMAALGRIPRVGDMVALEHHTIRVEAIDRRRVAAVRILQPSS
jgi:CBS domain containing-hemolysin-like protein